MDKIYVVKSVNVDKNSVILPDDDGVGVFLTYEDAKTCFDWNVSELKEYYKEYDPHDVKIMLYQDEGFNSFWIYNPEVGYCDFVGLYECEFGKWNGRDVNWFKKQ